MNSNHVSGTTWGPIEYRETGLYDIDRKLTSVHVHKYMSCFGDFNHTGTGTVSYDIHTYYSVVQYCICILEFKLQQNLINQICSAS